MKKNFRLPFDKGFVDLSLDEKNINGVLTPGSPGHKEEKSETDIIRNALQNPVNSPKLSSLAASKKKIVIITSDHTRAVPSALTLPVLLEEIRSGNPDADITILVATGLHRGMTEEEMKSRFGEEIFRKEKIVNHDAFDKTCFEDIGTLPSGSKCEINKIALGADLLIAEGFIEPHFFAGFSGGRKSVLPGIASQDCVNINHSAKAIASDFARNGILDGNPIHEDMIKACQYANLQFIFNVLLDEEKKVVAAYCGHFNDAHRKGCEHLLKICGVKTVKSDIVITTNGGYPLDQNLYQCPKGLASALECVNEGGVIILVAACRDGLGGENFGSLMQKGSPEELMKMVLDIEPEKTISEQWCVQRFSEALIKYSVILVTGHLEKELVEKMNFIYAADIDKAVETAFKMKGEDAKVTIIPDGVAVIVRR